jgi:hypothetical protein
MTVGLMVATLALVGPTDAAADSVHHVYGTGSDGLWLHGSASLGNDLIAVLPSEAASWPWNSGHRW